MNVWGINALNHGTSLSLFEDGHFVQNLVSNDEILELPNKRPDKIYWYERPWLKKFRQVYAGQYKTAFDMSLLPNIVIKKWGLSEVPITYTPHHASHAAAGYYTSPFNHCAVVVLDAIGEFECATIWEGKHGEMRKVWSKSYPHSLGLFYSAFTKLLDFKPIKEEYLFEELSNHGDPNRFYHLIKKYIDNTLNCRYNFHKGVKNWPVPIKTLEDRKDIASAVQLVFEEQVCQIMAIAKNITHSDSLVYMGGCAMNKKANEKVLSKYWNYCWSLPNAGDISSSIGSVLYHTKKRLWNVDFGPVKHLKVKI